MNPKSFKISQAQIIRNDAEQQLQSPEDWIHTPSITVIAPHKFNAGSLLTFSGCADALTTEEIKEEIAYLQAVLDSRRDEVKQRILTLNKSISPAEHTERSPRGFKNPNTGEIYTHGPQPQWFKDLLATGVDRESLRV